MTDMFSLGQGPDRARHNTIEDRDSDRTIRTTAQAKERMQDMGSSRGISDRRKARNEAIDSLVRKWIDDGRGGMLGRVNLEPDYNELRADLDALKRFGRTGSKFNLAIEDAHMVLNLAIKTFCDEWGYSYVNAPSVDKVGPSYTQEGGEYYRIFKWSVMESACKLYAAA